MLWHQYALCSGHRRVSLVNGCLSAVFCDRGSKLEPKLAATFLRSFTAICESLAPEFSTFQRGFARGKSCSPTLLSSSPFVPKGLAENVCSTLSAMLLLIWATPSLYCPRWYVCNPETKNGEAFVSEICHIVVTIRDSMKTTTCYVTGVATVVGYRWRFYSANTNDKFY